jgi:ABC-type transport system involved in multi-copper enzyme maturation permease subunit
MNPFMTLVRKDWRLNRVPLIGLTLLTVIGYSIVTAIYLWSRYDSAKRGAILAASFADILQAGAAFGMSCTILVAAAFGAVAFAQERREGWADFLAVVPATRMNIIASKLIAALACILPFCCLNLCASAICDHYSPAIHPQGVEDTLLTTLTAVTVFGFAWLLSTFMKSDALAACSALIIVALSSALATLACYHIDVAATEVVLVSGAAVCAAATIIGGSAYYCRRVAP